MGQYFSNDNLPSEIKEYSTFVLKQKFIFKTDNGVFCKDYLDFGTRTLLENIPFASITGKVLDVGCGYGVMGIVLAKLLGVNVDMIDVNRRALHLAKMNAKINQVDNLVNIFESDCYQNVTDKYQTIITNPPIRAGKKIVYEILFRAKEYLLDNGQLFLVIRKDQGAKSLISDLEKSYNVSILTKSKGFLSLNVVFD